MSHLSLNPRNDLRIQEFVSEFILDKKLARRSPATLSWYREKLGAFADWLDSEGVQDPSEINRTHVRGYLANVDARNVADATLHGHARAVRAFMNWCENEGYVESLNVPMPKVELKRPDIPTNEDLQALLTACLSDRDRALVLLLADTGLRAGEAASLDWGDVDLDTGLVRVRRSKSKRWRSVVLGASARRALMRYRRQVPHSPTAPLWASQQGGRLTRDSLCQVLKRASQRAGVSISPQDVRRWFAVNSLRGGMSLEHLRRLLGHSDFSMIRHYVELLEDDLKVAHEEAGPVDRFMS